MDNVYANPGELKRAARAIKEADALLIATGAGMGVDSGLAPFRGPQGLWTGNSPYKKLNIDIQSLATPAIFMIDPALAWGFYGFRQAAYRTAQPHKGFEILKDWTARKAFGSFNYTSNIDGQFQKAGFAADRVFEIHGSSHFLQCSQNCGIGVFPGDSQQVEIDESTLKALEPLPCCTACFALARPNVLMFNDLEFDSSRSDAQEKRYADWLNELAEEGARLVVVELGAGTAIPSVRNHSEKVAKAFNCTLVRINPVETGVPEGQISLAGNAKATLEALQELM